MQVIRNKSTLHSHSDLIRIGERWLLSRCGFAFRELSTISMEIPDVIGFRSDCSIMIECKTTRSDFFADKKKRFRRRPQEGVGDYLYFMCNSGLINIEDLPPKWGLLWVSPAGRVTIKKGPRGNVWRDENFLFQKSTRSEISLMYSALRRLHLNGAIPLIYYNKYRKE